MPGLKIRGIEVIGAQNLREAFKGALPNYRSKSDIES
jgi:hypothetical protein